MGEDHEKGLSKIYFGHRSIQEFLAAEHLFETNFSPVTDSDRESVRKILNYTSPEMVTFLGDFF